MTTPQTKSFNGDFLLYRKDGPNLRRRFAGEPRFRHKTMAAAEAEAGRLLGIHPDSTFIILQEVGRVKLKEVVSPEVIAWADKAAGLGDHGQYLSPEQEAVFAKFVKDNPGYAPGGSGVALTCRRAGCEQTTVHPSGMCEDHYPGFAQGAEAA